MKFVFITLFVICSLLSASCNRNKNENTYYPESMFPAIQAIQDLSASDDNTNYQNILNGDLSEWAGTWINNSGETRELRSDGYFGDNVNGIFYLRENGAYSWSIGGEYTGVGVALYPAGIEILGYSKVKNDPDLVYGNLPTDKTKVRICLETGDSLFIENIFYKEEDINSIQYSAEFNNQMIFINIFYIAIDSETRRLERAVFNYNDMTHTLNLDGMTLWYEALNISADDYNFDGYTDINIIDAFGANSSNNVFLYNPQINGYYLNNELSFTGSITVDKNTHSLIQTFHDYDTDKTKYSEYVWENGGLAYIRDLNSDDERIGAVTRH